MLDRICSRYGQRPSEVIGISNEIMKFDFDVAVIYRAQVLENENQDRKSIGSKIIPQETDTQRIARIRSQLQLMSGIEQV